MWGGGKRKENESGNITLGGSVPSEKGGNSCNKTPLFQRSRRISQGLADLWTGCGVGGGSFCLMTVGGRNRTLTCEIPCAAELLLPEFEEHACCFPALSYFFLNWKIIHKGYFFFSSPPSACFSTPPAFSDAFPSSAILRCVGNPTQAVSYSRQAKAPEYRVRAGPSVVPQLSRSSGWTEHELVCQVNEDVPHPGRSCWFAWCPGSAELTPG